MYPPRLENRSTLLVRESGRNGLFSKCIFQALSIANVLIFFYFYFYS